MAAGSGAGSWAGADNGCLFAVDDESGRLQLYAIEDWDFLTNTGGNAVAEESPSGQIHLAAEATSGETYAFARRTDIAVPNDFSVITLLPFSSKA